MKSEQQRSTRTLYREALAALCATTGQNLAARFGGHTRTKTMSALTMQIARLVSTLHAGSLNPCSNTLRVVSREETCAKTST